MKILAFGEVLFDIIHEKKHIGGAPLNFAAHSVKCGARADILSSVGSDDLGKKALEEIKRLGVGAAFVQVSDYRPTGTVNVTLKNGSPSYTINKEVAYDYIDQSELDFENLDGYDAFYFGTLAQREETSRRTLYAILDQVKFPTVFYDVNLRKDGYSEGMLKESLKRCNIVKLNDEEVIVLASLLYNEDLNEQTFTDLLLERFPNIEMIIVTKGPEGCTIYQENTNTDIPSEPVTVKDTVGAGDSFSASFLVTYLLSGDARLAAKIGNKVGGYVASQNGAIPEYSDDLKMMNSK